MRVTVLRGGPSEEKDVSLRSGAAVAAGLRARGHDVYESDVSPADLSGLDVPADVVFPALHGAFGEDGELQAILQKRGIAFVGSDARSSRLAFDKVATKEVWRSAGLPTPRWLVVTHQTPAKDLASFPLPAVCKPVASGSSIGVAICKTRQELEQKCEETLRAYGRALVEQFIKGKELTVAILDDRTLPPIRITTIAPFYDKKSKYEGGTEYHFDLDLPEDVVAKVRAVALESHRALGCRQLSRVDVMVDEQNQPWLLEINTLPGCTDRSLLPKAAGQAGISFPDLVDQLVRGARPAAD